MTLSELIENLKELEDQGYGSLEVYYSHGASGDCGPLSSAHVTDYSDSTYGPFDLAKGEEYVSIYAGN